MRHWTLIEEAPIPGSGQLLGLYRNKDDFFINTLIETVEDYFMEKLD